MLSYTPQVTLMQLRRSNPFLLHGVGSLTSCVANTGQGGQAQMKGRDQFGAEDTQL